MPYLVHSPLQAGTLIPLFVALSTPLSRVCVSWRQQTGMLVVYVINSAIAYLSYLEAKRVGQVSWDRRESPRVVVWGVWRNAYAYP